jgi:NAD(P)-dependent dehydrogenase (short-subunit alcohol dehydrogenase family)
VTNDAALADSPIAAVTGASRGIGRATALLLAREGYRIFALARTEEDLRTLAAEAGASIEPVVMDIADGASRSHAVDAIMVATNGYGLDVLVNNAGYGLLGPLEEVTAEEFRHQLEVNVIGLHDFTRPFLPVMRQRRHGRIVNVSSAAGRVATPFMGAYNASKFALEGLSDALRRELAPFGVRVILIEPGPIKTHFNQASVRVGGPESPYAPLTRRWNAARRSSDMWERSEDAVARTILKALRTAHPRPRYTVTLSAKMGTFAHRVVPDLLLDWVLGRAMGSAR